MVDVVRDADDAPSFACFWPFSLTPRTDRTSRPPQLGLIVVNFAFRMFGSTFGKPATTTTTPAFGGFGTNTNTAAPAQPVFGSQNTGGSLFGAAKPATTGAAFGNAGATGTQPAAGTGSLFGGGGAFGTNTQALQQQQVTTNPFAAPTGGSLFGSQNPASTTQPGPFATGTQPVSSFGGFGQPAQQQQQQQQPQQQTTNIFGQPQQNQQSQPQQQPPVFGGFGQSTTNAPNTNTTTTNPFGSSLFGASTAAPAAQATTSVNPFGGFNAGASTSGGIFGQKPSGLGLGGSTFGGGLGSSTLGTSVAASSSQQQNDSAQAQFAHLVQRMESIVQSWDPSSPGCRFQVGHFAKSRCQLRSLMVYCDTAVFLQFG